MSFLVFISHSSKDKLTANAICSRLESHGVRCWIAPRDVNAGADYSDQIEEALERSHAMVLVFSSETNHSRHVKSEIDRAFNLGQTIIPFRVEAVEPDKGLSYYLGKTHWLDAMTPPLEEHIDHLAEIVRLLSGAPTPSAIPAPPAIPVATPPLIKPARGSMAVKIAAVVCVIAGVVAGAKFYRSRPETTERQTPVPTLAPIPPVEDPMRRVMDRRIPLAERVKISKGLSREEQQRFVESLIIGQSPVGGDGDFPQVPKTPVAGPTANAVPAPTAVSSVAQPAPENALLAAAQKMEEKAQKVSPAARSEMKRKLASIAAIPEDYMGKEVELNCFASIQNMQGKLLGMLTADPMWVGAHVWGDVTNLPKEQRELAIASNLQVLAIKGRVEKGLMGPTVIISSLKLADPSAL